MYIFSDIFQIIFLSINFPGALSLWVWWLVVCLCPTPVAVIIVLMNTCPAQPAHPAHPANPTVKTEQADCISRIPRYG